MTRGNLSNRIKHARLARGLTLEELAQRARCTRGYLSQIENGKNAGIPSRDMLAALEAALSLTPGTLVGLGQWARLEPHVRERASASSRTGTISLDALYQSGMLKKLVIGADTNAQASSTSNTPGVAHPTPSSALRRGWVSIPLMNVVQAGVATEHADLGFPAGTSDECAAVPREMSGGDVDAFACRVVGASMEPEYREGDVVVFSPNRVPTDGRDCFVRLEAGGVTFKRVWFVAQAHPGRQVSHPTSDRVDAASIEHQRASATDRSADALPQSATSPLPLPSGEGFTLAPGFVPVEVGTHTHMVLEARNTTFGWRIVDREEVGGLAVAISVVRGVA